MARQIHVPVLAGHPDVELGALVDCDLERARELASRYGVEHVYDSCERLDSERVDAALICTPATSHRAIAAALSARGLHLFVEKPIASSALDAEAIVQGAEQAGVILSVGLYRRLLPSTRLARAVLESAWFGLPRAIDHREGSRYGWPASTLSSMSRELAGGGVLIDCGAHALDQLIYLFGDAAKVLGCRHNAAGGVESDCVVELDFSLQGRTVPATVELSRTRKLRNTLRIECERAVLELDLEQRRGLRIQPLDAELVDTQSGKPFAVLLDSPSEREQPWLEPFRVEIDDWLSAIAELRPPLLSGRSALGAMRLIDESYRIAQPLEEPGLSAPALASASGRRAPRRVLVTGASGFVGGRAALLMALEQGWSVRAAVHTPAHASRLARLPVEMVIADLRCPDEVRRLVRGCDAIVHCAMGKHTGPKRELYAVNVDGTRHLAQAAHAAGVERFVHLSTIAVHGLEPGITLDASSPLRATADDDYSASKVLAENVIEQWAARGLPAVILRPTRIYGPFSQSMIVGPLENLRRGKLAISRQAVDAPAQMMFVDNAVWAILCALEAPASIVCGKAFLISDDQTTTCHQFYRFFADAVGLSLPIVEDAPENGRRPQRAWSSAFTELLRSPELVEFGNRVVRTDPPGKLVRALLDASPWLRSAVRRGLGVDRARYLRPAAPDRELEIVRPREKRISVAEAQALLGYRPIVPLEQALEQTLAWARYAQILPGG